MWNVCRRIRERDLSSLLAGCSLTCRDFQKGLEKIVLERKKESMSFALIGQCVTESLGEGIDSREKINL